MKRIYYLVFLIINCFKKTTGYLKSEPGKNANIEDFPFVVSVRKNGLHLCGGSILNGRFVLTAAQCVCIFNSTYSIEYGSTFRNKGTLEIVKNVICHPNFSIINNKLPLNDIALLELLNDLPEGNWDSVDLANEECFQEFNSKDSAIHAIVIGWWKRKKNNKIPSKKLRMLDVTLYDSKSRTICAKYFHNQNILCVDIHSDDGFPCSGGYGGPLIQAQIQIGLYSVYKAIYASVHGEGDDDDAEYDPIGFTKISSYYNWIVENSYY